MPLVNCGTCNLPHAGGQGCTDCIKALRQALNFVLAGLNRGTCKGCDAEILWGKANGRAHPFDPSGASHFATCPKAEEFRKTKGGS